MRAIVRDEACSWNTTLVFQGVNMTNPSIIYYNLSPRALASAASLTGKRSASTGRFPTKLKPSFRHFSKFGLLPGVKTALNNNGNSGFDILTLPIVLFFIVETTLSQFFFGWRSRIEGNVQITANFLKNMGIVAERARYVMNVRSENNFFFP